MSDIENEMLKRFKLAVKVCMEQRGDIAFLDEYLPGGIFAHETLLSPLESSIVSLIQKAREDERKRCADKLREVAKSCGKGGHTSREKMFNAIATEIEAEPWKEPS